MIRPAALGLLLLLNAAPALTKGNAVKELKADTVEAFLKGEPVAVVHYEARGDKGDSKYDKEFAKFCEQTPTVRCGEFNVDSDYGLFAGPRNVLVGTPITVFYDAAGEEIDRLKGPQAAPDFAAMATRLYGGQ